jgi:polyisoprenyl-phosphate glycosyltransferase
MEMDMAEQESAPPCGSNSNHEAQCTAAAGCARQTVSIVVPVYYNEHSLQPLYQKLCWLERELTGRSLRLELIFVDDGSQDGSYAELCRIKAGRPATKVIKLARNFGAVAASNTGFQFVSGDCFMILAADLQDPVEKVLEMIDLWRQGSKFVVCVREKREDPLLTKCFAGLYYRIVKTLVFADYPKGGFDLMLMDKIMLPFMARSSSHLNPSMYALWLGFSPVYLTYCRQKREHGKSRWTFRKKLNFFVDTVTGFSVVPIRLVSLVGITSAILGFLYGIWMIINALVGNVAVPGFVTVVVLLSFFSGLILFMLGILGEYLWRIFDLVNTKPKSVIEEVLE